MTDDQARQSAEASPDRLFQMLTAYQTSAILKAAIDLDVFGGFGAGAATAADLAQHCRAHPNAMRMLADGLTVLGLLSKAGNTYKPVPDCALFLDRRSPAFIGSTAQFLLAPELTARWSDLSEIVRRGGPPDQGTISAENPIWVKFARGMASMMAMPAKLLAAMIAEGGMPRRVLDIAAGHGLFGIEVAKLGPEIEVAAVDWPNVLEVVRENARAAGLGDRVRGLPGSAFDVPFGGGYDLVLLTNFLHHFDRPTCETLLTKVHGSLAPGGRAVALEFVPNDDRVTPPMPALFALTMLVGTPRGDAYTFAELESMYRNAGFARVDRAELPPTPQRVVVGWKA